MIKSLCHMLLADLSHLIHSTQEHTISAFSKTNISRSANFFFFIKGLLVFYLFLKKVTLFSFYHYWRIKDLLLHFSIKRLYREKYVTFLINLCYNCRVTHGNIANCEIHIIFAGLFLEKSSKPERWAAKIQGAHRYLEHN